MKQYFPSVYGNTATKERLASELSRDSLSHAYIISGSPGSGKFHLATTLASAMLCDEKESADTPLPCGRCHACDRISRGIHPDVIVIEREGRRTLGVDSVRRIKRELYVAPDEAEHKLYIIKDAETMTPEAQNALLISLEEPPPFVTFILLTTDHTALLETIRSRAELIRTEPLSSDEMKNFLASSVPRKNLTDEYIAKLVADSGGIPGRALELLGGDTGKAQLRTSAEELFRISLAGSPVEKASLAASVTRSRDELLAIVLECKLALRDVIARKKRAGVEPLFFTSDEDVRKYMARSITSLYTFYALLERSENELRRNASPTLIAERIIMHKI